MQYSAGQVVSFVILLVGTAAIVVSIATDHWSKHDLGKIGSYAGVESYRGLWRSCTKAQGSLVDLVVESDQAYKCQNRFELNQDKDGRLDISHREAKAWELSCLGLMCSSALLGIVCLLFSPCCCNRCGCWGGCCLVFWVLLAALCAVSGVGTYAYQTTKGQSNVFNEIAEGYHFGWSFYVAVGGAASQLLASVGFGISSCRQRSYSHNI